MRAPESSVTPPLRPLFLPPPAMASPLLMALAAQPAAAAALPLVLHGPRLRHPLSSAPLLPRLRLPRHASRFHMPARAQLQDRSPASASPQLYPGVYGPWSVDSADVREAPPHLSCIPPFSQFIPCILNPIPRHAFSFNCVALSRQVVLYRAGLVTVATTFITGTQSFSPLPPACLQTAKCQFAMDS